MLSLILSILCSAMIAVLMRYGEKKLQSNMAMFIANYAVCVVLSRVFMGKQPFFAQAESWGPVALFGAVTGVLYLVSFVLMQRSISTNGLSITGVFTKLGVIVPTLMAIVVFHEQPKLTQLAGIAIAIAAVVLITYEKNEPGAKHASLSLIILLLFSGMGNAMSNIFDKLGNPALKDHYLLITFLCALLCAGILALKEKQRIGKTDILLGVCIGIPNYFSARFLLDALRDLPAMIVYPVFNVMTVVVITIAGIIFFREKLNKRKTAAMLMIMAALVCLNI